MSRFKKCGTTYCDNIATKRVRIYHPEEDIGDKLGGWINRKDASGTNVGSGATGIRGVIHKRYKIHRKEKVWVCKKCYEEADPQEFIFEDKSGNYVSAARVDRL